MHSIVQGSHLEQLETNASYQQSLKALRIRSYLESVLRFERFDWDPQSWSDPPQR